MGNIIKDPIYQQLNKILRELIAGGEFKSGDQFLTERKICEKYDVSRATANKALSNLVSEGILEFKKGVGTFVAEKVIDFDLRSLISFTNITKETGKKPATKVLQFETLNGKNIDPKIVEDLNIIPDEKVYYVERLRLVDKIPSILERRFINEKYCPGIDEKHLENSLYTLFVDKYKLKIIGVSQVIKSVLINSPDFTDFKIKEPEAGFLVSAIGYIEGEIPLWTEKTIFRGSKYEFRNSIGQEVNNNPNTRLFINI